MSVADRIALLRDGRLLQFGTAEELYTRPATAFTARFLSDVNELAGTCQRGRVETILGNFAAPHVATGARPGLHPPAPRPGCRRADRRARAGGEDRVPG